MRTSNQILNSSLKKQIEATFLQLIADTKTIEEASTIYHDILSPSELDTFIKRLAIAYWLKKGRSYNNIKTNLKVSSATIASVQEMMKTKGFELALKKIEAEEWANQWSEKIKKFVGK